MAITYIDSTEKTVVGTTQVSSLAFDVPTHQEGDFFVAFLVISEYEDMTSGQEINPPAGWTQLGSDYVLTAATSQPGVACIYRWATGSEPSTYTWTCTGATTFMYTTCTAFRDVDTSTPIDVTFTTSTPGTGHPSSPSIDIVTSGAWGVFGWMADGPRIPATEADTYPTNPNFNGREAVEDTGTSAASSCLAMGDEEFSSTGLTGTRTWTSESTSEESGAWSLALRPAPTGGNFDQDSFRGKDDGTETTENWVAAVNTDWDQFMDQNFRIRFLIEELDDVEDLDVEFQLQYNRNDAGWNDVNASSSYARSSAGSVTDGENTTEQLDGPGTFITPNAGVDEVNGLAGGTTLDFTTTANQEVELEYTLQLRSADLVKGDTVDFRLVKEADIALGSYTNTPTVTPIFSNLVQTAFRGKGDGTETTENWKAGINTNWTQAMDVNFRIRFLLSETNDWAENNFDAQLQYNLNEAGWNDVNASSSVARSSAGDVTDGEDCTEQLDGSRTFISNNDGVDEVDGLAGGANLDFTGDDEAEVEFTLQLRSADLSEGDTVQFRIENMDVYSMTPTVTPQFPTHFIMVLSTNFAENDPTTQQLTAQSGTFVPGTISESTPEADPPITIVPSGYTEYEFCIEATTTATASAQYEFRLVDEDQAGEKLEVYTVVPKVTLAP